MEKKAFHLANGSTLSLSQDFILPDDNRSVLSNLCPLLSIPVINMKDSIPVLVKKISQACEEYGFFQIINHGVPSELCQKMVDSVTDFFSLPPEERALLFTNDKTKPLRVSNYYLKVEGKERVTMWSETLAHPWHPVEDLAHLLPQNPPYYREIATEYAKEIGSLMNQL
ncbi:2-oxoglutarate (2OG) and Fe(II)-dependent oxygenase superfamily protein [Forsythia ovata]|uniref:2-oxoglutarate (2OG) and Fe(II)-dependent oxygenase superfamily protein n=1 Tax=Forsythia ovata TaxID=205694 RepID=A0ABD1WDZ2_9LAMI